VQTGGPSGTGNPVELDDPMNPLEDDERLDASLAVVLLDPGLEVGSITVPADAAPVLVPGPEDEDPPPSLVHAVRKPRAASAGPNLRIDRSER
jgi:hypothetical protein